MHPENSSGTKYSRPIAIKKSPIHGYGVFACKDFKRGDYIATVLGSKVEYKSYFRGQSNRYANWIGLGKNRWVDPVDEFQYVNHSCNPSAGLAGDRILKVYALRNIRAGEEITIDYSITEDDEAFEFMNCEPEHESHRKVIGPIQSLPVEVFKTYLPFIPTHFRKVYEREVLSKHDDTKGGS